MFPTYDGLDVPVDMSQSLLQTSVESVHVGRIEEIDNAQLHPCKCSAMSALSNLTSSSDQWNVDNNSFNFQLEYLKELSGKGNSRINYSRMDYLPDFVTGGFQQYLNRLNEEKRHDIDTNSSNSVCIIKQPDRIQSKTTFNSLPVYVKLHIFSFLEAKDLCRMSGVNREWSELTNDNVLWNDLLEKDMSTWKVIGHSTNPALYREVDSDWSNKEIYVQCCPKLRKMMRRDNLAFLNISTMLRSLWPRKSPKIALFGPGLETKTSGIVRKMLQPKGLFEQKRMFPGQFEGVGSGMTLAMRDGLTFDLSVLYSSTKTEREARLNNNRMQRNRLVQRNVINMEEARDPEDSGYELTPAVRDLCRTLDAFIYVVDATQDSTTDNLNSCELFAMVNERWSSTHVPVLILTCIPDPSHTRVPCFQVAESLQLHRLDRPWQVHDCEVDTLSGLTEGLQWLIEQSQRR